MGIGELAGRYVFVVDLLQEIYVAPDGHHMHPRVLGMVRDALYAGEIHIDRQGHVDEITNCSGTFQFGSKSSLCCVASHLRQIGFAVASVIWFPPDGVTDPVQLQCP